MGCLVDICGSNKDNNITKLEYLYILMFLEIMKKADPRYVDIFIAAQYIDETKTFPINDNTFTLLERVLTNQRKELELFIQEKYEEKINVILNYIKDNCNNPCKYNLVPMEPNMKRTVDEFLFQKVDIICDRIFRYKPELCWVDRDVETMTSMVISNFHLNEVMVKTHTTDWRSQLNRDVLNSQGICVNPEVISQFINQIVKNRNFCLDHNIQVSIIQLQYLANILNILMHLIVPVTAIPKTPDTMFKDLFNDDTLNVEKVKSFLTRSRHLNKLNVNNIVTAKDVYFYDFKQERVFPYDTDHLVERYLVLLSTVNSAGYFCGML